MRTKTLYELYLYASLPLRGAWIEIFITALVSGEAFVAPLAGGVD